MMYICNLQVTSVFPLIFILNNCTISTFTLRNHLVTDQALQCHVEFSNKSDAVEVELISYVEECGWIAQTLLNIFNKIVCIQIFPPTLIGRSLALR